MRKIVHKETLCCGFKKCPTIRILDDGSLELTDNDPEAGSVGTIKLRPEAVERLSELLTTKQ